MSTHDGVRRGSSPDDRARDVLLIGSSDRRTRRQLVDSGLARSARAAARCNGARLVDTFRATAGRVLDRLVRDSEARRRLRQCLCLEDPLTHLELVERYPCRVRNDPPRVELSLRQAWRAAHRRQTMLSTPIVLANPLEHVAASSQGGNELDLEVGLESLAKVERDIPAPGEHKEGHRGWRVSEE